MFRMTPSELKTIFDRLNTKLRAQSRECDAVDSWTKPELATGFTLPHKATVEHQQLAKLSRTPWLKLVVDNVVQAMYVDSITGEDGPNKEAWSLWMRNGLQSRQVANHRSMVSYGHSYGVVSLADGSAPRIRFLSPRRMAVEYADMEDPYPSAALEVVKREGKKTFFILRMPGVEYRLSRVEQVENREMEGLAVGDPVQTGLSYVPVVQFANQKDLDGNVTGEVLPLVPAAKRINKTSYDRLLAQHYNSWKVRWATGLELPEQVDEDGDSTGELDREATEQMKLKLGQDDILVGESADTKFGTLDATALDPFVNSWRSDIEALASTSQTPTHALTGQMVNLSAEALAAARAPLTQKVYERQMNAAESYSRLIRTGLLMAGDFEAAEDDLLRVTWQDMEIRSMSQAADALGKIKQMLNVPARALWGRIPGVERSDVLEWERIAEEEADLDPLNGMLRRNDASTTEEVSGE